MAAFAGLCAHAQTQLQSADGEWPMAARDYANARYSAPDQINTTNVRNLKVAFSSSARVDNKLTPSPPITVSMLGQPVGLAAPFEYSVAMSVRKGDTALRDRMDEVLRRRKNGINAILDAYFVPRLALSGRASGMLPNSADNLQGWIMRPRAVEPHPAMPELGVTAAEARDIAAYLYSQ